MASKHKTHRFSQEALDVIQQHQQRTGIATFSEALEDIIKRFGISQNKISARLRRAFMPDLKTTKTLEEYTHA